MKIISVGCSFTEGLGLKNQAVECYTARLADTVNLEFYNYGACGASNDYIFRKVFDLINSNIIEKDDILIVQWTHFFRKELPIVYNDREWYYYVPNSMHAYQDKVLIKYGRHKSVQSKYINQNLDADRIHLENSNKKLLEQYNWYFLNKEYQKDSTKNYINSIYTYLEHFGYNHLHFFGWDNCIINDVFNNKSNFLNETFGGYTNTINNHHPNKEGHEIWAEFLYKKIKELDFKISPNKPKII